MQFDWIIDVLGDLKEFAARNGLHALADQLDDTRLLAATEISNLPEGADLPRPATDRRN